MCDTSSRQLLILDWMWDVSECSTSLDVYRGALCVISLLKWKSSRVSGGSSKNNYLALWKCHPARSVGPLLTCRTPRKWTSFDWDSAQIRHLTQIRSRRSISFTVLWLSEEIFSEDIFHWVWSTPWAVTQVHEAKMNCFQFVWVFHTVTV